MGKNHQHKKKLKSEKAKVHIKTKTKFLPKGQNVTNTSFKIKSIIIPEQLKNKEQDPILIRKNFSISELITKLKHFNSTIKTDACEELKDIIKKYTIDKVYSHLSLLIQCASLLIQDRERKVRKRSVKLIDEILSNASIDKIRPLFGYLSTNLRCAMTNIDRRIQEDSLLLLDSLLNHTPVLIAEHSDKIFPDFLTLISQIRNESSLDRTLTLNLGSKLTNVHWRIKVLSRLYGILNGIVKNQERKSSKSMNIPCVEYDEETFYVPFAINWERSCDDDFLGFNQNSNRMDGNDTLMRHVATLIPLLYETWLEVVPERKFKQNFDTTILNEEARSILTCIVHILHLLHQYLQSYTRNREIPINIFETKEANLFVENLLVHFPYNQGRRQEQKIVDTNLFACNNDSKCIQENLLICFIFYVVIRPHGNVKQSLNSVVSYVKYCMMNEGLINTSNVAGLLLVLNEMITKRLVIERNGVNFNDIVENIISFSTQKHISEECKKVTFNFLTLPKNIDSLNIFNSYKLWLEKLPHFLCENEVSEDLVNTILFLVQRKMIPHQVVESLLPSILDNLQSLKITKTSNGNYVKLKIVYLFYYIPNLLQENLDCIHDFVLKNEDSQYAKYLKSMLQFK